jgi:uncharacterized protein (DUF488 family)
MIFTIGFTQKSAEVFFNLLTQNKVDLLIDIRLNNTSQLAGFAKFPDIQFFLNNIGSINYIHDTVFSPIEDLLKDYKSKKVSWNEYENIFEDIMLKREINTYIQEQYTKYSNQNICLLCSEATAKQCHRRLVAEHFKDVLKTDIVHL